MEDRDLSEEEAQKLLDQLLGKVAEASEARAKSGSTDAVEAQKPKLPNAAPRPGEALPSVGRPRKKK